MLARSGEWHQMSRLSRSGESGFKNRSTLWWKRPRVRLRTDFCSQYWIITETLAEISPLVIVVRSYRIDIKKGRIESSWLDCWSKMVLRSVRALSLLSALLVSFGSAHGSIGAPPCVAFQSSRNTFPVVSGQRAAPVFVSPDDWPGVQRAAGDFVADIQKVTGVKPTLTNLTLSVNSTVPKGSLPIFVGTLGRSALIDSIVNSTGLDVSGVRGAWEAFVSKVVQNPVPSVERGYVIVGADKRGTIYALYEHSEQFGELSVPCHNQPFWC